MSGGALEVEVCKDENILMTGEANIVFKGKIDFSSLKK